MGSQDPLGSTGTSEALGTADTSASGQHCLQSSAQLLQGQAELFLTCTHRGCLF